MKSYSLNGSQVFWGDEERVFRRGWRLEDDGERYPTLFVVLPAEHPSRSSLDRFRHEYELKEELDTAWAVHPLDLTHEGGRAILVLEDPGGEPLERLLGSPMETGCFLRLALGLAVALGKLHQCGLVHRDLKPVHILANEATGAVRLTGFGIASRLTRERQAPRPPETLAGTLAYMAPEQTGRMNRSVDSRSDLYALGVVLYRMLTGALPFTASEPMEWVHCQLARRPVSPAERLEQIPGTLSAIVMKLLAKRAEDRYQTAAGLERDLRRCQSEWETQGRMDEFSLGQQDIPDRLLIPEKLYGREHEVETLLGAFERVVNGGTPELVLVSGYSGIGKSSVVNELQPVLVPPRGLFASGKFDQYKRDIPYSTLAQAFRSLIQPLLGKREADLEPWRNALQESLGANSGLIIDLVPEVKLIVGEPPPVPELPPQDAQRRFQLVFRRFIGVFARPEHPLALFLDDLQWLDAATLDLLGDLLTSADLQHLLLIGAYRDNEVSVTHPLMHKLEAIRSAGGSVQEITLGPLALAHLGQLISDGLRCELERSAPLAQLVHEKTGGNPFFAVQFIQSLAEEGMLAFHHDAAQWSWNLDRVRAKTYADNVVELMVGRLSRLPGETQTALQHLACLGNVAEIALLAIALESSEEQVHAFLRAAVGLELVVRLDGSYKFIHDRVQEASYSLIPERLRAQAHLRIGRQLAAHLAPEKREEAVFEIVGQLNRGAALIALQDEREQLAELNLTAGKRAKASTAYVSALKYLIGGAALLAADAWERCRDLIFALELERAECEFLTGELESADKRLTALSKRTTDPVERTALACLHMGACTELLQFDRACAVALDYLQHWGIEISPHPTEDEARREYEQIWSCLGDRTIESVTALPVMSDPESLGAVDVLTRMLVPAALSDQNLNCLTVCKAVNLSLERGNCDASCLAYLMLGRVAVQRYRDYETACRFGQVALDLVEDHDLKRFQARAYVLFAAMIAPWMKHVSTASDLARRAFEVANRVGDFTYINYANTTLNADLLVSGDSLSDVQRQAELGLAFAQKARFSGVVDVIIPQLALVRTLRGLTPKFGCFDSEQTQEVPFERHLRDNPYLRIHECWYWIRKMQARYFSGDYQDALEASTNAQRLLWISPVHFEEAECHFYSALCAAASCDSAVAEERQRHLAELAAHHRQLEIWAERCPENFENRAALLAAEIARIESRDLDAMRLYEKAISSSRTNAFAHNEALAYERASEFYRARGLEEFADAYLRSARSCYLSWGADGKVRQLDQLHPWRKSGERAPNPTGITGAALEQLDLATIIRVSQAVSGEIALERLIDKLMRTAIEQGGAARGLLMTAQREELQMSAEATVHGKDVTVHIGEPEPDLAVGLPASLIRSVLRTRETVLIDDAASQNPFSTDPYLVERRVRSILCLPLINKGKLVGVLYLENNLTPRVFTPERSAVLKVLASQAAISLENTRLYRDLEDREAKIRRLVDANILGVLVADVEGSIIEANDAFLRIVGYSREDLVSARVRWTELTPPEWRERDLRGVAELRSTGTVKAYEKEYFRRDGSRVPVLIGAALFKEGGSEGVAFVLDLTARKRAEQALRQLESDLAHVNRLNLLGELTASLAHEVKQPIAAARNNARAAQNFLSMHPPDLGEVREAVACVVSDVDRAGEIIDRVSEQIKKAPPRKERCDLNAAINEVIDLARSMTLQAGVSVETRLGDGLVPIVGDRVQLQQVVLNLIRNAVEAMDSVDGGARELLISTYQDGNSVLVAVRDSGPGIDPEQLERVFESFYTTKPRGTGMGLSVCRSIIDAHGGRLWAGPNQPRGALFQFTLPSGSLEAGV